MVASPEAWQPENPVKWLWPNGRQPLPLPVLVHPAMTAIGGIEFDEVLAAREMEEWREAARTRPAEEAEDAAIVASGQWWRDVSRVIYEPPGAVSLDMVEARVIRHLILERALPLDLKRIKSNAAVLADLKRSWADVYGAEADGDDWAPAVAIVDADWRDFDVVLGWLVEAAIAERELVVLRAKMGTPPATWRRSGMSLVAGGGA